MSLRPACIDVLYIEDDRIHLILMGEVFRRLPGWTLHGVESGEEALQWLNDRPADLVLLDMNLPDMSGLELHRRLCEWQGARRVPCVALSADADELQVQRTRDAGFVDYWHKPIDVLHMQAQLAALAPRLQRWPQAQAA